MTDAQPAPQQSEAVTNPTLRASVIVPVYNSQTTIEHCLGALEQQTLAQECYEIIVVDDGSTDDTRARIQVHNRVRLLVQHHAGPAVARNLGVQHARGEIVLFTDGDCEPARDWIEQMLIPMQDPRTAGVKGTYRTRQQTLVARFVQREYETRYERTAQYMARYGRIDFVDTYSAGYRRDVFVANGGFDPTFATASVEDQEFSFRMAEQGHLLVFAPLAAVYHWGHAATISAYVRKKFKIAYHKVKVLARHSGKAWQDAHTPQSLKAQILLLGLGGCSLAAGLIWPGMLWAAVSLGSLFLLTTLPFVAKTWKHDPAVAIAAPLLLTLRALALGSGMVAGLIGYAARQIAELVRR